MTSSRPQTARKPVGSGSAFRPVPEYGPSAGQITSSPYINAIPGTAASEFSSSLQHDPRRLSRESVHSDRFYDTEQPDNEGSPTGFTTETTSPTSAQAPVFPHHVPSHLYHRYEGGRQWDQPKGYQKLPSEGPESGRDPLTRKSSGTRNTSESQHSERYAPEKNSTDKQSSSRSNEKHAADNHAGERPSSTERHYGKLTETDVSGHAAAPKSNKVDLRQNPLYQPYDIGAPGPVTSQYSKLHNNSEPRTSEHRTSEHRNSENRSSESRNSEQHSYEQHNHEQHNHEQHNHEQHSYAPTQYAPAPLPVQHASVQHTPYPPYSTDYGTSSQESYVPFGMPFPEPFSEPYTDPGRQDIDFSTSQVQPLRPSAQQPAPHFGHPFAVYGDPYLKDSSALDDDGRASSERSLSPTHSVITERGSSQSLVSDTGAATANMPAAVSEMPPGALYRRQVSTSARPRKGTPFTLASLAIHNSSSDLSPRASTSHFDTPTSMTSPFAPFTASSVMATDSPVSDQQSEAASRASRTSATSVSGASQGSRQRDLPPPPPEPRSASKQKDESLGIGVGSAYVQRIRVDAAETHISKVPAVLPIGIRARAKSTAMRVQPEFLRKAMDIRYTHLPQRMLETEVDDDDTPFGQQQFPGTKAPPGVQPQAPAQHEEYDGLDPTQRSNSPVESVMERTGKIKLFVANPDDESD